jgi:signal transduction histidine kinase
LITWLRELELSAVLGTPLATQPAGRMLVAVREADRPGFTRADQELFMILGRQAGAALENARLYSELRESLKNIEMSQQALIESEKQAAAGRLTAAIAHEINNPLQALQNCLDLASRKNLNQTERTHYLELAKSELVRLMSTVQRMLDFYRPGVRDRKSTQVNDLLERILALMKPQFDELGIVVHLALDPKLPLVMVVSNQIQQLFFTLLINAMEAIPDGGEIWVQTRRLSKLKPPAIEIIIEDSGPGIPESQRANLFKPVESTKEKGTGLGLSVSYGIMTAHGGKIPLLDGRGRGACFQLILPEGDKQ